MAIRVLIVDDSSFFRRRINEIISSDPGMEVVGSAANGKEAVAMVAELRPDVVTMDVEMPVMDGINAVKNIMSTNPTPIIMFSSLTKESADITFNALEAGALDFITKTFDEIARNKEQIMSVIRDKIRDISRKKYQVVSFARSKYNYGRIGGASSSGDVNRGSSAAGRFSETGHGFNNGRNVSGSVHPAGGYSTRPAPGIVHRTGGSTGGISGRYTGYHGTISSGSGSFPHHGTGISTGFDSGHHDHIEPEQKTPVPMSVKELTEITFKPTGKSYSVVAIGASTGGPIALQNVLTSLPSDFPLPIILVQHMPGTFTTSFAARLDKLSRIKVVEAQNGEPLLPGCAYLAPGGKQMYVENKDHHNFFLKVTDSDPSINFKPCVDLTFASINNAYKGKVLAVILTGMGSDGCKGCRLLRQSGATIWAQNEETCVIYGMPQAVVNESTAEITLPIQDIGRCIVKEVMSH